MITIAQEPIEKRYISSIFSRGFCLSYFCYFLVVLVPLLILVNINYSWPEYQRVMILPTIQYKAYQLTCLDSDDAVLYSSNFDGQIGDKNYNAYISASVDNNILIIKGSVLSAKLLSCSLQIYLATRIQTGLRSLVSLPLEFHSQSQSNFLSEAIIKGKGYISSNGAIPQSSIITINQSQYAIPNSFSFINNWKLAGSRNISINVQQIYEKIDTNTLPPDGMFNFEAKYQITKNEYLKQTSLIYKIRQMGPIFIFLAILLYYFIIDPLVDYVIQKKIYSGKTLHAKLKSD